MIVFEELKWKNFLSTGNKFNVINLNDKKTNLIVGTNGMGKSTILDAITFVLFNKPFRKINMPQLVNSVNNRDCLVEITFTIGPNSYKIVRGIKPKVFEVWENGNMLQQDAAIKDYQEHLENHILKMNYKAFTQIVVIGNATYQPFMKLSPNDRRNIVETFLDIDIFTKMNSLLKSRITETKEKINDVSYKYDLSHEKIKMAQTILSNSEESIQKKIDENNSQIEKKEVAIAVKNKQIEDLNEEITAIVFNQDQTNKVQEKINKLNEYLTTFKTKKKSAEKEINFLEANDSCGTCKQIIDPDFKEKNLTEKKESVSKLDGVIKQAQDEISKANTTLTNYLENLQEIKERKSQIDRTKIDLDYLQKDVDRIIKENASLLKEKKDNLEKNKEEYQLLVDENQKLSDNRDLLLSEQHLHSIAAVLLKDDGIKTKIIRYYLPVMNKLINKYLHLLDFYINYSLDENFEEKVKTPSRDSFTYNSFSEGEKLRVDLAILFAWREIAKSKNSTNTNLLLLDEIFDSSLDNSGIDDFLRILDALTEDTNVFVISHKGDSLFDKFTNVIRFEKVNGFSKIM
jgi:DNA repair exonuclease SbcCD ATPase subunit